MDNLTALKNAHQRITEVQQLLGVALERGNLSSIDRDLILEKLRRIYDELTFEQSVKAPPVETPKENFQEQKKIRPEKVEPIKQEPVVVTMKLESVRQEVKPEHIKTAQERPAEIEAKPTIEKVVEIVSKPEPNDSTLGLQVSSSETHSPVQGEILADKFKDSRKYRNESIGTPKKDVASKMQNKPISDLTKAIGINDKFLYTKELFNGNAELYSTTIKKLNNFTDINDALIFVQENFHWDENNDAANRLLELVRRKLLAI